MNLETVPRPDPDVIGREVDQEAVLVLPKRGKIKVLNDVGARIWQLCNGQNSVSDIVDTIYSEYDVERCQAESDTLQFLEALAQRGMISIQA